MSRGAEIATPVVVALDSATERIEQQAAVAALHQREAQARETHGTIAKVIGFPAAVRYLSAAEEGLGDLPIACLLDPAVERAQRQDQALSSGGGQFGRVPTGRASGQAAP